MQKEMRGAQATAGGAVKTGEGVEGAAGIGCCGGGIKEVQRDGGDENRQRQQAGRELGCS